jgi:cyclopropane fatty-acyl-phospholipid synthase-like methyltransferase
LNQLPDISDYYDEGVNAGIEERNWAERGEHAKQAAFFAKRLHGAARVLEIGPGSGRLAELVKREYQGLRWLSVERSVEMHRLCCQRYAKLPAPRPEAHHGDVRQVRQEFWAEIVVAFAMLKHFGLHEIDGIVKLILSFAPRAVFDVQILGKDHDNGTKYHHTYITEERLQGILVDAGHLVVDHEVWYEGELPGHGIMKNLALCTARGKDGNKNLSG